MALAKIVGFEVTPRTPWPTSSARRPLLRNARLTLSIQGLWPCWSKSSCSLVIGHPLFPLMGLVTACRRSEPVPNPAAPARHLSTLPSRLLLTPSVHLLEQGDRGREAVEEVSTTHGTELACGEETGHGNLAHRLGQGAGVVVGAAEQPRAATVAGEHQGRIGVTPVQHAPQVLVGGDRVTEMELDRRAQLDDVVHGDGAGSPIGTDHVANEEVAPTELGLVLVDDATEVQPAGIDQGDVPLRQLAPGQVDQTLQGRLPAELVDDIALGAGNGQGV